MQHKGALPIYQRGTSEGKPMFFLDHMWPPFAATIDSFPTKMVFWPCLRLCFTKLKTKQEKKNKEIVCKEILTISWVDDFNRTNQDGML